ncbi:hypothetical protein M3Y94_00407200 [Aphelenchoides besseyi]|nr:hypothetical protein M3Y94_00407200 [Aphelenchoides besseyi]
MRIECLRSMAANWMYRLILLLQLFFAKTDGEAISIHPFNGAFILRRPNDSNGYTNNTRSNDLYLQNGCPSFAEQTITTQVAGHSYSLPIYPTVHHLYCSVNVRLAQDRVHLDRPYLDIIAIRDSAWMNMFKHRLCVTVQLTNDVGASVSGSCVLDERRLYEPFCLIRQIIPLFLLISVSYSVKSECSAAEIALQNQRFRVLSSIEKFSVFGISTQPDGQLTLLTRSNLTFSTDSMSSIIFHYKQNPKYNDSEVSSQRSIRLWVSIDERFEIVSASPLNPKQWRMKAENNVNSQRVVTFTLTPVDDGNLVETNLETYLFALLIRMRNDREAGRSEAKGHGHSSIVVHWTLLDVYDRNEVSNKTESAEVSETSGHISRRLTSGPDSSYVVVPIPKSIDLINTAVITGLQVSTIMRVFSISLSGRIRDITDQSHCSSAEPRILKVSPTCTSVFVDGSELRGLNNVNVNVEFQTLRASIAFNVWFPRLPVSVWLADRNLNAINDWRVSGWKPMDRRKRRGHYEEQRKAREARQSICNNRFQQTEVRVLASFQVVDELSGDTTYLSGSRELMFDITQVAMERIHSSDSQIVGLRRKDGRLLAVGNKPGTARIVLKAATQHIDYGGSIITVVAEKVSAIQLLIRVITDVHLSLTPSHYKSSQYELITYAASRFTQQYQHGAMEIEIFYSDGERELLSDVDTHLYVLSVIMSAADVVRVRQQRGVANVVELVVLDDRLPPDARLLTAEMRGPAVCDQELSPLASGQIRLDTRFDRSRTSHLPQLPSSAVESTFNSRMKMSGMKEVERIHLNISDPKNHHVINVSTITAIGAQPLLALLIVIVVIFCVYHAISGHSRKLHDGYEKLVMPLLARLSSSGSLNSDSGSNSATHEYSTQLGEGENTKEEWVWLSKRQLDSMSVGNTIEEYVNCNVLGLASHFSQRSTLGISNGTTTSSASSSSDDSVISGSGGTNRSVSISYRGSEISVFISPQASVSVNENQRIQHRATATWQSTNGRSRVRSTIAGKNVAHGFRTSNILGSNSVHDRLDEFSARGVHGFPPLHHNEMNRRNRHVHSTMNVGMNDVLRRPIDNELYHPIVPFHDPENGHRGVPSHRISFVKDGRIPLPSYASLVYADDELTNQQFEFSTNNPLNHANASSSFYAPSAVYTHQSAMSTRRLHGSVDKLGFQLSNNESLNDDYPIRETVA